MISQLEKKNERRASRYYNLKMGRELSWSKVIHSFTLGHKARSSKWMFWHAVPSLVSVSDRLAMCSFYFLESVGELRLNILRRKKG